MANLHSTYPSIDSKPAVPVTGIAATPPGARRRPEPPNSETTVPELRKHSVFSDTFVKLLETTAADVEPGIADASPVIQELVESWCELHGYAPDDDETPSIIAHQAVFALLLKGTLYEWHHQRGDLPEFTGDARENFQLASQETGDPAFTPCTLDEILWSVEEADTTAVTEARDRLLKSTQPATDIGRLYETLILGDHRRVLGQYRTPQSLGQVMRTWATSGGDVVLDPGMGAGELSEPFHPDWEISTDPDHVHGIDRSPLAALAGRTAQTIAGQQHGARRSDFFDVEPTDLDRDVDAVLCNPPYTRHDSLPSAYKDELNAQAEELTGLDIPKTSPLYSYFYYHLRQFLDGGDRAAVLTPHHFLERDYGESLKRFLLQEFDIRALLLDNPENESKFDTAQTTDMVVFLEATDESDIGVTRFIRVDEDPGVETKLEAVRNGIHGETDWGAINCIEQSELNPEERWDNLFDLNPDELPDLRPLSDIAEVHRGLQTGENDFFCLSQEQVESWGIDPQYLSRIVPKRRYLDGYDVRGDDWANFDEQGRPTWLLYHLDRLPGVPETTYDDEDERAYWSEDSMNTDQAPSIVEYLRHGLVNHEDLPTRSSVHGRDPWYRVERGDTAPILVTPMSRSEFRAILNETNARHLNNYYGVYPDAAISRQGQKALLAYLNYVFADNGVSQYQRLLAGGLQKLEPGDVEEIPVIDPRKQPEDIVTTLAECLDELWEAARCNQDEIAVIERIDTVVRRLQ